MIYCFVRKMANKAEAARKKEGRFCRCTELPYPPPEVLFRPARTACRIEQEKECVQPCRNRF